MAKKYSFMDVPIGADKRYLVTINDEPFAGFDKLSKAKIYVKMQQSKKKAGNQPAAAAEKRWDIKDTKGL